MQFKTLAFQYMQERSFKHSTKKNYHSILSAHLLPAFGDKDLNAITASEIRLFQVKLAENHAGSRVNTIMQLFRCILAEARRQNLIASDPCKEVEKVRKRKAKVEPFTDAELKAIFAHLDRHYVPLFQTLLLTGMRPNEAFALTWEDIDFDAKTINIDKGMVDGIEDTPKTESSERILPLVDALSPILSAIRKDSGRCFVDEQGRELIWQPQRVWARALEAAGVKYRKMYNLRHTNASRALTKGISIGYLSKLLGHSSISTTLSFYARYMENKEEEQKYLSLMG